MKSLEQFKIIIKRGKINDEHNQEGSELTNGGDSGDDFTELELVQDGGLTSSIETHHQNPHFLLRKQPAEQLRERQPHLHSHQSLIHTTIKQTIKSITKSQIADLEFRSDREKINKNWGKLGKNCTIVVC